MSWMQYIDAMDGYPFLGVLSGLASIIMLVLFFLHMREIDRLQEKIEELENEIKKAHQATLRERFANTGALMMSERYGWRNSRPSLVGEGWQ